MPRKRPVMARRPPTLPDRATRTPAQPLYGRPGERRRGGAVATVPSRRCCGGGAVAAVLWRRCCGDRAVAAVLWRRSGAGAEGRAAEVLGEDAVRVADPGAQQRAAVPRVDQVLDAELLGGAERGRDGGQLTVQPVQLGGRVRRGRQVRAER